MTLPISCEILQGVYESLRVCPPFLRWGLPPSYDINFVVTGHKDREGHYSREEDKHYLCVSRQTIGHYNSLTVVMAHEMLHLLQALKKTETRAQHNADFRKRAAMVCRTLGFDPKTFC